MLKKYFCEKFPLNNCIQVLSNRIECYYCVLGSFTKHEIVYQPEVDSVDLSREEKFASLSLFLSWEWSDSFLLSSPLKEMSILSKMCMLWMHWTNTKCLLCVAFRVSLSLFPWSNLIYIFVCATLGHFSVCFFLNWPSTASFCLFSFFSNNVQNKNCRL